MINSQMRSNLTEIQTYAFGSGGVDESVGSSDGSVGVHLIKKG